MEAIPLFPTIVLKDTITGEWNRDAIMAYLTGYFDRQIASGHVERDLHKVKEFAPLVKWMDSVVEKYWEMIDLDPGYPKSISHMWANKYERNAKYPHNLENDSPSIVTVVFYVDKTSAEQGNLFFASPNEMLLQTQPLSNKRRYEERFQEFDGRTGDIICFPSWLHHGIKPNNTDIPRYSSAANYELKNLYLYKKVMTP